MKLSKEAAKSLAEMRFKLQDDMDLVNRANQTKDPRNAWDFYLEKFEDGSRVIKEVQLSEERADIFQKALDTKIPNINKSFELGNLRDILDNYNIPEDVKTAPSVMSSKSITMNLHSELLEKYHCKISPNMLIKTYDNKDQNLEVTIVFDHDYLMALRINRESNLSMKQFKVEIPKISKGFFKKNGSEFCFMYMPLNKYEFLAGKDTLKLEHPILTIIHRIFVAYTGVNGDVFLDMKNLLKMSNYKAQSKINRFLNHTKEFFWEEDSDNPVIWFDSQKGSLSREFFSYNILINMPYDEVIVYPRVVGIDMLTGSTSRPAKRCKPAYNWEIVSRGSYLELVPKSFRKSNLLDYVSEDKIYHYGYSIASGKRNNSATSKDTFDLIKPSKVVRRNRIIK